VHTSLAAATLSEAEETDYIDAEAVEVEDTPAEGAPKPNKFMSAAKDAPDNVDPETGEIK